MRWSLPLPGQYLLCPPHSALLWWRHSHGILKAVCPCKGHSVCCAPLSPVMWQCGGLLCELALCGSGDSCAGLLVTDRFPLGSQHLCLFRKSFFVYLTWAGRWQLKKVSWCLRFCWLCKKKRRHFFSLLSMLIFMPLCVCCNYSGDSCSCVTQPLPFLMISRTAEFDCAPLCIWGAFFFQEVRIFKNAIDPRLSLQLIDYCFWNLRVWWFPFLLVYILNSACTICKPFYEDVLATSRPGILVQLLWWNNGALKNTWEVWELNS